MPIAFPPEERGADWNRADAIRQKLAASDNRGADWNRADAIRQKLVASDNRGVNLRSLGFDYEDVEAGSKPNPAQQFNQRNNFDNGVLQIQYDWARSNTALTGVTRDSTGAILAGCRVTLNQGNVIVAEATSDGSGRFTFSNPGSGPFFIVAYKAGSPAVAGITVNTLLPAAV
jgi:hypothetical protein